MNVVLEDGSYHVNDSSEMSFRITAKEAFRKYYMESDPYLMEPIMKIEIEIPREFQGVAQSDLSSRRGNILDQNFRDGDVILKGEFLCRT